MTISLHLSSSSASSGATVRGGKDFAASCHSNATLGKVVDPICRSSCCCASFSSMPLDLQSVVAPLVESLRSELQNLIAVRLEEVLRPLREEASTIKLWLARVANHLERDESCGDHTFASDMAKLFGPCSPVQRTPTSSILTSLAEACTPTSPSQVASIDPIVGFGDPKLQPQDDATKTEEALVETPLATTPLNRDESMTAPVLPAVEPPVEDPPIEQIRMQVVPPAEDVVIVEDASDDEAVADVDRLVEDPIFLITIEDSLLQSTIEVKANEAQPPNDPPMEEASSLDDTPATGEDPINAPSPQVTRARRRRKSYDRFSLRRSARLAQRDMLKN
ncbi:hypothetical protein ACP70R_016733 [Stipagrostis hirtigluma subsp. patula]